ncbi:NAD(P)-binding protein [Thozetella sp. PMI_491]|nr:NAD(P)-binding protein [Thozetella sp. PMI_491]
MTSDLPTHHRALVLETVEGGFEVKRIPTPQPDLGVAVIRVHVAGLLSYHREIYNGDRHYSFPKPLIGGCSAIGRIAALGPDATVLEVGQLVFVDCVIHARDDPDSVFLTAIHDGMTDASKKLCHSVWRDGTFAELCGSLGYSIHDLMYLWYLLVPFGGLRDIDLKPGETVIVCPATGGYGGAGVQVAIAMGARVIAMGRNEESLSRLKSHVLSGSPNANISIVKMTGDEMADAAALQSLGTIDAVLDFTPPGASKSSHLRSAVRSLRRGGRVSMMGFNENPMVPVVVTGRNISLKGKLMYEREDIVLFMKMLERGLFPRGKNFVDTKCFPLEEWKACLDAATEYMGIGRHVIFTL